MASELAKQPVSINDMIDFMKNKMKDGIKYESVLRDKYNARGVYSQEMPGMEVPLGWVAIFELRYRDGSRFLPFGISMGLNFCHQV